MKSNDKRRQKNFNIKEDNLCQTLLKKGMWFLAYCLHSPNVPKTASNGFPSNLLQINFKMYLKEDFIMLIWLKF